MLHSICRGRRDVGEQARCLIWLNLTCYAAISMATMFWLLTQNRHTIFTLLWSVNEHYHIVIIKSVHTQPPTPHIHVQNNVCVGMRARISFNSNVAWMAFRICSIWPWAFVWHSSNNSIYSLGSEFNSFRFWGHTIQIRLYVNANEHIIMTVIQYATHYTLYVIVVGFIIISLANEHA